MNKDTGGPAFPQSAYLDGPTQEGMALRDYFAAKAMQAVISDKWYAETDNPYEVMAPGIASDAYLIADAMLAERVK